MTNISNLTQCSIDSIKIRIPLFELDTYDETISRNIIEIIEDTGEVDRLYKKTRKDYEFDCFKLTANIFELKGTTYLFLLVNSKQLQHDYFKGITPETIKTIYALCIEANIMSCSYATFMQGFVTDIDFKKDFLCILDEYQQMNGGLNSMTKQSSKRDRGANLFPKNMGIEFSSRNKASITNPFTKVYHKETELRENSYEFSDRYLQHIDFKDIIRIETTIKDKKHLNNTLGKQVTNNLDTVLNLSTTDKDKIMSNGFNRHLLPRTNHKVYDNTGLSSRQLFDLQLLDILINKNGYSFDQAIESLLSTQTNKNSKYKLKKSITKLYSDHIHQVNYTEKSANINAIYDKIGWK
jgi:hypothetical protein